MNPIEQLWNELRRIGRHKSVVHITPPAAGGLSPYELATHPAR